MFEVGSDNIREIRRIFYVLQNLYEEMRGAFRKIVDLIRKKFPVFLTMRVFIIGCAAGAGELGACNPEDEQFVAEALSATLRKYARENRASLVVFKDFPAA